MLAQMQNSQPQDRMDDLACCLRDAICIVSDAAGPSALSLLEHLLDRQDSGREPGQGR